MGVVTRPRMMNAAVMVVMMNPGFYGGGSDGHDHGQGGTKPAGT